MSDQPKLEPSTRETASRRDRRLAVSLVLLVVAMVGLAYAAVPLYDMFCRVTGYGGTTQRAERAPDEVSGETVTVRFDANISPDLNWSFQPVLNKVQLKIGQNELAFYRTKNLSNRPITGTATFNVTPEIAGGYFNKIQCFCFQEQRLEPGESVEMPVSFFVDPAILEDEDTRDIREITLSYTFFPVKDETPSSASVAKGEARVGG